jgi:hypothetical protein
MIKYILYKVDWWNMKLNGNNKPDGLASKLLLIGFFGFFPNRIHFIKGHIFKFTALL